MGSTHLNATPTSESSDNPRAVSELCLENYAMDADDSDSAPDDHSSTERRAKESDELIAQKKAQRRAKKDAKEAEEAARLIDAAQGTRSAKKKGLENRGEPPVICFPEPRIDTVLSTEISVWLEGKRQTSHTKDKSNASKKAKVGHDEAQPKEKKTTSKKRDKVPSASISQRASATDEVTRPHKTSSKSRQHQPETKASRKLKRKRPIESESEADSDKEESSSDSESADPLEGDLDASSSSSSDDSTEFDRGMSESGLTRLLESEQPVVLAKASSTYQQASDLFDVDDEYVERVSRKGSGSSSQTGPPTTSDSESPPRSIFRSWEETQGHRAITRQSSSSPPRTQAKEMKIKKSSQGRTEKFQGERPTIVSAPPRTAKSEKHKKSAVNLHSRPGETRQGQDDSESEVDQWPPHTVTKGPGLLQQNVHIRATCHRAIKIVEKTLVSEQAWPELHRVAEYRVEVLTQAAKALEKSDSQYRDIRKRVQKDDDYARSLGKWVVDRLAHARGPVRQDALDHIAVFQLGINETCAKRVTTLLATDTYVYPGHWERDSQGNEKWIVRGNQIYLNTGIINVLRSSFFSSPAALGYRYKELYRSSHPERPESELTVPLVALAATGIHAALDAWKDGNYIKKKTDKFDGETYKSIFNRHVKYLHGLKAKNINAYHSIMSEIHSKVIGNEGQDGVSHEQGDALAVLDLSGFD